MVAEVELIQVLGNNYFGLNLLEFPLDLVIDQFPPFDCNNLEDSGFSGTAKLPNKDFPKDAFANFPNFLQVVYDYSQRDWLTLTACFVNGFGPTVYLMRSCLQCVVNVFLCGVKVFAQRTIGFGSGSAGAAGIATDGSAESFRCNCCRRISFIGEGLKLKL